MATDKTPQKNPRRLGRGLDALFNTTPSEKEESESLREIPIGEIRSNPFQPRRDFNPDELNELQESLKASGLLQPVTVRRRTDGAAGYELVAGERRLRAATNLGWTTISAVVRVFDDRWPSWWGKTGPRSPMLSGFFSFQPSYCRWCATAFSRPATLVPSWDYVTKRECSSSPRKSPKRG